MTSPAEEAVHWQAAGGVATLTMDQPQNRNAMTPELLEGVGRSVERAVADPTVRLVVLAHTGPAFSAGADIKAGAAPVAPQYDLAAVLALIQDSPKPVLAQVAGHCFGGGVGLAAAADIAVAADDVFFGFSEVRIGVAPAIISVVCLPKLRPGDALELFLTGRRVTARRAAEVGLISRAVAREELAEVIAGLAEEILAGAPGALAAAKRLVYHVPTLDRPAGFEWTAELSQSLFLSEEAAEGRAAFTTKRRPAWAPIPPEER